MLPHYEEYPLFLQNPEIVHQSLSQIDWAFTDDDTRFLGHDLHPYPAKFIPQIPGTIISLLSSRGELVFDPFGGSGTTALEAIRLGRRALSLDANPIAALIGRVKTAKIESNALSELNILHASLRAFTSSMPVDPSILVEQFQSYAPIIANRQKWFPDSSFGELAYIRSKIIQITDPTAQDIGLLALSRTVLSASFQDSETRYKSVPRNIPVGETTRRYIKEFEAVMRTVTKNASATRYGITRFLLGDAREISATDIPNSSVDLIVTSPPYGNATDYHLYHRFRLLWMGYDPVVFGKQEIGSHLKHQRESSGFEEYFNDMVLSLTEMCRVLKNGRYAVLVIGDSIYNGNTYDTARLLLERSQAIGFSTSDIIERDIHRAKRSFTPAGRRALKENILILRKTGVYTCVFLMPPPYKLWPYERVLQYREGGNNGETALTLNVAEAIRSRSMAFTHQIVNAETGCSELSWQAILENGMASTQSFRRDPKYVTHGLHSYKGKFYPQLAKGLLNLRTLPHGSIILDPFCGSGTTLLEGYLNGFTSLGCDINPLAAKIARAKNNILDEEPDIISEIVSNMLQRLDRAPDVIPDELEQFAPACLEEIQKWFAIPVARKLNWLLRTIRATSAGVIRDFLEVILSSIIRDVSQQAPTDLRIRYRSVLLEDADVFGIFREKLETQYYRIERFWKIRGYSPNPFYQSRIVSGDNRIRETFDSLGLHDDMVDVVLTSPPYAMALPYIDTDRLSLLTLLGINSNGRRSIEQSLIGSREIPGRVKKSVEEEFLSTNLLPNTCQCFVRNIHERLLRSANAGFRKRNMPALIYRFLSDIDAVFIQLHRLCKAGGEVLLVIGDSKITIDNETIRIPTTELVQAVAESRGFAPIEQINISVTTENFVHIRNAITNNAVLRLRK